MVSPHTIRRIILGLVIALVGFAIGFVSVYYYKQSHPDAIQRQPAPVLPLR